MSGLVGLVLLALGWKDANARDAHPPAADLYKEEFRPQFHFTARQWTYHQLNPGMRDEGWLNDLNGLVYVAGEWHLFAQRWANCWIHAVSKDLIHWTELKPAFWTDHPVDDGWVQSGTVVIDSNNVTGLKSGSNPLMVAFWSSGDNQNQCMSYSNDLGRTWTKYAGNPVLAHRDRDPQVFWHAQTNRWIMVLYDNTGYTFFTSTNLLNWQKQTSIAGFFECPDMFALAVDGNPANIKWVLMNGDGSYRIGAFNGTGFTPESASRRLDWGNSFYATQSFHHVPAADGRRIQLAWMRSHEFQPQIYPNMPFNQQTSFPAELTLRNYAGALRIFRKPVREIQSIHQEPTVTAGRTLTTGGSLALDSNSDLQHILAKVSLEGNSAGEFLIHGATVRFSNTRIGIDGENGSFATALNTFNLEILVDRTSIEAFGNDGEVSVTNCIRSSNRSLSVRCTQGSITLDTVTQYPLKSAWPASVTQGFNSNLTGPWSNVGGAWKDTATGKKGSGPGDNFSLSSQSGTDFTYEGEVEVFTAAAAALVFRANAGATQGYVVNVDAPADVIKLWAPGRGELATFPNPINTRQPYHLKVVAKGANIKVYFNHRVDPIINYSDPNPVYSGRFGVNVYGGIGQVQDLKVGDGNPTRIGTAPSPRSPTTPSRVPNWTLTGRKTQILPKYGPALNPIKRIKQNPR